MTEHKCQLTLTFNSEDELNINLDNPGKTSLLLLIGALDLVKFSLQSSMSNGNIKNNKEDSDASSSI